MSITRQHFEAIANAIALTRNNYPEPIHEDIRLALDQCARAIAFNLVSFNPNFDKDRFLDAARKASHA